MIKILNTVLLERWGHVLHKLSCVTSPYTKCVHNSCVCWVTSGQKGIKVKVITFDNEDCWTSKYSTDNFENDIRRPFLVLPQPV